MSTSAIPSVHSTQAPIGVTAVPPQPAPQPARNQEGRHGTRQASRAPTQGNAEPEQTPHGDHAWTGLPQ